MNSKQYRELAAQKCKSYTAILMSIYFIYAAVTAAGSVINLGSATSPEEAKGLMIASAIVSFASFLVAGAFAYGIVTCIKKVYNGEKDFVLAK